MPRGRRSRSGRRSRPGAGLARDAGAGVGRAGRERDLGERAPRRGRRARSGDCETRRLGWLEHAARILRHLGSSERRSADACSVVAGPADGERLRLPARAGHGGVIRRKSGLPLDPMFSAAKARWLLDRLPQGQARAKAARSASGQSTRFSFRASAARRWSKPATPRARNFSTSSAGAGTRSCCRFSMCPSPPCRASSRRQGRFRRREGLAPLPDGVSVGAVMADSHSALFAHGAFAPGPVKATHGTGSSVMGLVDRKPSATATPARPAFA